jgi:hypothetical protein
LPDLVETLHQRAETRVRAEWLKRLVRLEENIVSEASIDRQAQRSNAPVGAATAEWITHCVRS